MPKKNLENLQQVLLWLYGSKPDGVKPVINSQNPDLKLLGAVLENPRARVLMLARHNLQEAYAQVGSKNTRFEAALVSAKQEVETALSQITGYDSEDSTLLEIGKELRDNSEQLYDSMESISKKAVVSTKSKGKK